ncbi:hypothetical protein CMUS01_08469 [Colletotrichum musicola]|uniref:Uncharacterized protein n=1 Tax=Colletotrichum musicola TaxID=2175873 RepID=A0A8H6KDG0_9PEZI|nr:hypothetical protein CMUS01_08469 [Colletotrichum musicola]
MLREELPNGRARGREGLGASTYSCAILKHRKSITSEFRQLSVQRSAGVVTQVLLPLSGQQANGGAQVLWDIGAPVPTRDPQVPSRQRDAGQLEIGNFILRITLGTELVTGGLTSDVPYLLISLDGLKTPPRDGASTVSLRPTGWDIGLNLLPRPTALDSSASPWSNCCIIPPALAFVRGASAALFPSARVKKDETPSVLV